MRPNLEQLDSDPWAPQSCPVALHPLQLQRIHSCHHLVKYIQLSKINRTKSVKSIHLLLRSVRGDDSEGDPTAASSGQLGEKKSCRYVPISFYASPFMIIFFGLKMIQISTSFHSALSSWKELPYASQPYGSYGFYRNLLFVS